jgi:hypothetical protein
MPSAALFGLHAKRALEQPDPIMLTTTRAKLAVDAGVQDAAARPWRTLFRGIWRKERPA